MVVHITTSVKRLNGRICTRSRTRKVGWKYPTVHQLVAKHPTLSSRLQRGKVPYTCRYRPVQVHVQSDSIDYRVTLVYIPARVWGAWISHSSVLTVWVKSGTTLTETQTEGRGNNLYCGNNAN
eukprot:5292215-Pyramimonas_sp.AAC.1